MTDVKFNKEGRIENLDELTAEEVAEAYFAKNQEVFGRVMTAEEKAEQTRQALEKAEKDLIEEKNKKLPVEEPKTPDAHSVSDEELRLIARGLSDEELDEARAIAKGKGISLNEAIKTPIFQLFQGNLKVEREKEEARLGASHGSDQADLQSGVKPGMTREEHKALFDEASGNLS